MIPLRLPRPLFCDGQRLPAGYCNFLIVNGVGDRAAIWRPGRRRSPPHAAAALSRPRRPRLPLAEPHLGPRLVPLPLAARTAAVGEIDASSCYHFPVLRIPDTPPGSSCAAHPIPPRSGNWSVCVGIRCGVAAERRPDPGRRSGLRRPGLLRRQKHQNTEPRPTGHRRHALHELLRAPAGLHGVAGRPDDRLLPEPRQPVRGAEPPEQRRHRRERAAVAGDLPSCRATRRPCSASGTWDIATSSRRPKHGFDEFLGPAVFQRQRSAAPDRARHPDACR